MAPPKVGAPTVATHKQTKRPLVAPVFMETPRASASKFSFHRDYIPPRKDTMPQVRVPIEGKLPIGHINTTWCHCRRGHARKDRCFEVWTTT
jgi:hypothetical protein